MKITLHGAAGEVTGSAYLVETDRARVLVDFGLFQGGANTEAKNVLPSGLELARLDAVLVTHAHLDHTGRLPLLCKNGYAGPLYATQATSELSALILKDSAKVQGSDVDRDNRKRAAAGKPLVQPLYTAAEVEQTLQLFRVVGFEQSQQVAADIQARYVDAGHMLGSASIELTVQEDNKTKVIAFSGDIGPTGLALVQDAHPLRRADVVFLESTYGDRDHKPLAQTLAEFRGIVEQMIADRSRILVPTFAVGRAQQILYHLDELFCAGTVKPFPVYLDSPMAIEASAIYRRHPDLFDDEAQAMLRDCSAITQHSYVKPTPTPQDSMALNNTPGPCMIMAGSGMCTAGRILHHLRHGLPHPETTVMIVGFQGEGSLGRLLVDGAKEVKIFGEKIAVQARIRTLNGFSAHAGQTELLRWVRFIAPSKPQVILTHGEARGRNALAEHIQRRYGITPVLPMQGDIIRL